MVPLSALNLKLVAAGQQYMSAFVAISGTDFPAISSIYWDYDLTPAVSAMRIAPRYAMLVYVVNQ